MSDDRRSYHSPLRDERAADTRSRILQAATELLAQGASALTVPAVAREAGVAVPTVYRHFSNKEGLEDGVAEYVRAQLGILDREPPAPGRATLEEWLPYLRRNLHDAWSRPRTTLAVQLSSIGRELMGAPRPGRLERITRDLADDLDRLPPEDRRRFSLLASALGSTPASVAFMRLGLDADEAGDVVAWALRTLLDGLERPADT